MRSQVCEGLPSVASVKSWARGGSQSAHKGSSFVAAWKIRACGGNIPLTLVLGEAMLVEDHCLLLQGKVELVGDHYLLLPGKVWRVGGSSISAGRSWA